MKPFQYRKLREFVGSRLEVARLLGIHPETLRRRETGVGENAITREAAIAILALQALVDEPEAASDWVLDDLRQAEPKLVAEIITRAQEALG